MLVTTLLTLLQTLTSSFLWATISSEPGLLLSDSTPPCMLPLNFQPSGTLGMLIGLPGTGTKKECQRKRLSLVSQLTEEDGLSTILPTFLLEPVDPQQKLLNSSKRLELERILSSVRCLPVEPLDIGTVSLKFLIWFKEINGGRTMTKSLLPTKWHTSREKDLEEHLFGLLTLTISMLNAAILTDSSILWSASLPRNSGESPFLRREDLQWLLLLPLFLLLSLLDVQLWLQLSPLPPLPQQLLSQPLLLPSLVLHSALENRTGSILTVSTATSSSSALIVSGICFNSLSKSHFPATAYSLSCPTGLEFSSSLRYCTTSAAAGCKVTITTTTTTKGPTTTTKAAPTVTTTTAAATTSAPFKCTKDGFFGVPSDCLKFIRCVNGISYNFECPNGLSFHADTMMCDRPDPSKCAKWSHIWFNFISAFLWCLYFHFTHGIILIIAKSIANCVCNRRLYIIQLSCSFIVSINTFTKYLQITYLQKTHI